MEQYKGEFENILRARKLAKEFVVKYDKKIVNHFRTIEQRLKEAIQLLDFYASDMEEVGSFLCLPEIKAIQEEDR